MSAKWRVGPVESLGSIGPGKLFVLTATRGEERVSVSYIERDSSFAPTDKLKSMLRAAIKAHEAQS